MAFPVYISDPGDNYHDNQKRFDTMDVWASIHCASYIGHSVNDVSDVSVQWDEIGEYLFTDEKDALLFTLKWK